MLRGKVAAARCVLYHTLRSSLIKMILYKSFQILGAPPFSQSSRLCLSLCSSPPYSFAFYSPPSSSAYDPHPRHLYALLSPHSLSKQQGVRSSSSTFEALGS